MASLATTGDQEVTGSIPAGSSNILLWRLVILSPLLIQEGLLSVSRESM